MKQEYIHGFPPCPMSAHCLRLLDDLDSPSRSQQLEKLAFTNDSEDERLVEQLRAHVPNCPTCSFALARARRMRGQQRRMLADVLAESEQRIPSTTHQIFAAIRREPRTLQPWLNPNSSNHYQSPEGAPLVEGLEERRRPWEQISSQHRFRTAFRNAVALATVAAIILAAIGIFNRANFLRHLNAGSQPTPEVGETVGWTSVVIGLSSVSGGRAQTIIMNYDPESGRKAPLAPPGLPVNTHLDGVSRDGHNLLYHISHSGHTLYYSLQPVPNTGFFYELTDSNVGPAIWESDSIHVLIATVNDGVVEVNVQTGAAKKMLPALKGVIPTFYSAGYMYFRGGQTYNPAGFYRVNITSGLVQAVAPLPAWAHYWLSPLGAIIYFANKFGPGGQSGLYAVNTDSRNLQLLRSYPDATPIGFAADNSLEFMRQVNGKFQVWKLGTPPQRDAVVLSDVAPGATSLCSTHVNSGIAPICEENIVLSPYGRGLVVHAFYADGSSQLVFDDLTTGKTYVLQSLDRNTQVQLPGWDRLALPGAPAQNFGGWNAAAIAEQSTYNPGF